MSGNEAKQENDKSDCSTPSDTANLMDNLERGDVKMAGYLEKKGKMKLLSTWKRYWFVLEGRLLLYYRSQMEYLNLSACRGSLNMGIASCVRPGIHRGNRGPVPGPSYIIEVITRTQIVTLRTKDRTVQEQWLQALLDSMALPNISSPMRNSGGPLHFRYSMDHLPTVDEMEHGEDKFKDKQGTLPRQVKVPSVVRRDSVLMRIKRLGGQSYGGSLDTILKRQGGTSVQHQPNIPKIKAVNRMLGLQAAGSNEGEQHLNVEGESKSSTSSASSNQNKDSSNIELNIESSNKNANRLSLNDDAYKNEIDISDVTPSALTEGEGETKCKMESNHQVVNISPVDNDLGVRRNDSGAENNRLNYSSTVKVEEQYILDDGEPAKLQYITVENQLYDKTQTEVINDQYDSLEELRSSENQSKQGNENEGMYEDVKDLKPVNVSSKEEDDYYCSYEQASVVQPERVADDNPTPEPILPPRPSISSPEVPEIDAEYVEYNACYEPNTKIQQLPSGDDKKGPKKKGKIKLRIRNKKSSVKDSNTPEIGENVKKRKVSFLRRMLKKRYRTKPKAAQDHESSDEPEYDTVDYSVTIEKTKPEDIEEIPVEKCDEDNELKDKVFGTTSLLPNNTLLELRQKLKKRDSESKVNEDIAYQSSEELEKANSNSMEKHPGKPGSSKDEEKTNETPEAVKTPDDSDPVPPQLPPRRTRRPSSPWHDVPTNNSPVYGNFNFQVSNIQGQTPIKYTDEEWSQHLQDEMLGTPQGFAYIQSKWKAAEKSGEWHREKRQVSFPANTRNQGPKLLRQGSESEHIIQHEHYGGSKNAGSSNNRTDHPRQLGNVDIYSKIIKKAGEKSNYSGVESERELHLKGFFGKEIKSNRCPIDHKVSSKQYLTENLESVNANKSSFQAIKPEMVREEHCDFQKDSLMTSICTQTESELEDSIVSIDQNALQKKNPEGYHTNASSNTSSRHKIPAQEYQIQKGQYSLQKGKCVTCEKSDEVPRTEKMEEEKQCVCADLHGEVPCNATQEAPPNRYSDELNLLLAQLAEITSAPLLSPGATKSLTHFPESKPSQKEESSLSDEITLLGPIRRRRHSEPDYDVPRPHNSLMKIGSSEIFQQASSDTEADVQILTQFLVQGLMDEQDIRGEAGLNQAAEDSDQSQLSWTQSMAPDSLEPIPHKYQDTADEAGS